ncbi:hypothetical protein K3762_10150 [Sulfitobacter sp. W074]|nr:hypothetical protein [Sulfitobacter sp. W074]UWR39225.1 hypothetical protein K3762_10150 [Sulfitobacter sp. W074]
MTEVFDREEEKDAASGGVRWRGGRASPGFSQLLKRERPTPLFGGLDQIEVMVSWDLSSSLPGSNSRVRLTDILGQVCHRRPDVKNFIHAAKLCILRIAVNTQMAKCDPQAVYLELPQP